MQDDGKSDGGGEHILLTALSGGMQPVWYVYQGRQIEAGLAPLAILRLLEQQERPTHVIAMLTSVAREGAWPRFREQVHAVLHRYPDCIEIPDGRNQAELQVILERVANVFSDPRWDHASVSLDITHGFRHFPLLVYTLGLYLHSMRALPIRGLFYGMLEGASSPEKPAALLNLQPILALPDWVHAVRVFRETGSAGPIAALLKERAALLRQGARGAGDSKAVYMRAGAVERLAKGLETTSLLYEVGMPLELGKAASKIVDTLAEGPPQDVRETLPLAGDLFGRISDSLVPFAFERRVADKGEWKRAVAWDREELMRQARVIDSYLERGLLPLALGFMREWIVSFVMSSRDAKGEDMLRLDARSGAEQYLGALARYVAHYKKQNLAPPDQQQVLWGTFWGQLAERRNALHHHGMRVASFEPDDGHDHLVEFWRHVSRMQETPPRFGGRGGVWLISSQGKSLGVLYSALQNTRPDACLVLCSRVTRVHAAAAVEEAVFDGAIEYLELEDPLQGFAEIDMLVKTAGPSLLRADRIVANLTGGTTLMSTAVQQIVEAARKLDRPTRRFALIDQRSRDEQRDAPFVKSELYWIDEEKEDDHAQA